jgi:NhaA family Na+:H+ antiporter
LDQAKVGVLGASLLAGILGFALLRGFQARASRPEAL